MVRVFAYNIYFKLKSGQIKMNGIDTARPEKWRLVKEEEERKGQQLIGAITSNLMVHYSVSP